MEKAFESDRKTRKTSDSRCRRKRMNACPSPFFSWAIGKQVTVKADHHNLTVYLNEKSIAKHARCYKRKERIELPAHKEAALKQKRKLWRSEQVSAFISLGEAAKTYLERLAATNQPIKKNL